MTTGTIRDLLDVSSASGQESPALLDIDGAATSYAQLLRAVDAISSGVTAAGVAPDRAVAVVLANGPLMATTFVGVSSAAVCAPLNPAYTESELSFFYDDLDVAALVTDGCSPAAIALAEKRGIPLLQEPFAITTAPTRRSADDVALVLHTSGTTARPKQVPLTHSNLCTSAANVAATLRLGSDDRCFNVMPLFHIHGIVAALLASLRAGGSVVCAPGFDAVQFLPSSARLGATWYTAVPTMHQAVLTAARRDPDKAAACQFRFVRSSSAALAPAVMHDLEELFDAPVIEAYGMTEASHQMTSNSLPPAVRRPGTVGVSAGSEIAIMALDGQLVLAGTPGEIVIRGAAVTAGYNADDAVNAAAFAHGWFHTGDQGVLDQDGYLTITGRLKEMINRGGEKISPREVEEVLLAHPAVAQAVVFAVPHQTLGDDVAAAVIATDGHAVTADDLRGFAAARLSAYKVPQRVVFRDDLPVGPTGKLQRIGMAERLGLLETTTSVASKNGAEPMSPLERAVAGIWTGVLSVDHVGRSDRFIELGGDSLTAVALVVDVAETFGVDLPVTAPLVEAPTVAQMAELITEGRGSVATRRDAEADEFGDIDEGALSIAQEGMWFVEKTELAASALHTPVAMRLRGPLDVAALERSVTEVVRRHEGLRTRFVEGADGLPRTIIDPPADVELPIEERVGVPEAERAGAARALVESDSRVRFRVDEGALFRARLLRFAPDDHVLSLVVHHLVADGWSRGTIRNELADLYRAERDGVAANLPLPPARFVQFAVREQRRIATGALDASFEYWRTVLTPLPPPVALGADRRGPLVDWESGVVRTVMSPAQRVALAGLGRDEDATLFMVLLAGFVATLHRHTGLTDIVVGVPAAGRTDPRSRSVIGSFMNILPVRIAVDAGTPFLELLRRVRTACLDAYTHQALPLELLVRELRPERSMQHRPLVQVLFQLRNLPAGVSELGDVRIEDIDVHPTTTQYELSVDVIEREGTLAFTLEYPAERFDRETVDYFAGHLLTVLRAVPADPDTIVGRLPLVTEGEREIMTRLGRGARQAPVDRCLHDVVAAVAASRPAEVAVQRAGDAGKVLTYEELDRQANQLAQHLVSAGVGRGDVVALCVPRDLQLLVALLAISKAGGAFVPLDPADPPRRIAAVMETSAATAFVTTDALASLVPNPPSVVVVLDRDSDEIARSPAVAPDVGCAPADLVYLLFTSGSTGRPKGVEVEHRNLVSYVFALDAELGFSPADAVLASSSLTFDAFVDELILPLCVGARIVLASDALRLDGGRLSRLLNDGAVTYVQGTPSYAGLLLDAGWQPGNTRSCWGGEALTPGLAGRLLDTCTEVWNGYGPTETTDGVVFHRVEAHDVDAGVISIGLPLPGRFVRVVEPSGDLAGIGVEGELLIGGNGVARGYRGNPDLTDKAFVDVATEEGMQRMYRSGDRCRWRSSGTIEFLGRVDGQVKLRGVRIELEEIEGTLATHPSVTAAVADVRDDRVVAWITATEPVPPADELRRFLGETLPRSMLPSSIQRLAHLPTSTAGKVDRTALPNPETIVEAAGDPPRGHVEERLAHLWCQVLRVDGAVYRDSDFFELGGHSMLAVELSFLVEREFGHEIPLNLFLTAPTLGHMAESLQPVATANAVEFGGPEPRALVRVRTGDSNVPLLLWVPAAGGTPLQLRRLASLLPSGIELLGFEAPPHRGEPEPETLSELAAAYADDVRRLARAGTIGPHRPFVLAGHSFGAAVAHEVAALLFDDCRPSAVILVDPLLVPLPAKPPESRAPAPTRAASPRLRSRVKRVLRPFRARVKRVLRRIGKRRRPNSVRSGAAPRPLPVRVEQTQAMTARLRATYGASPYPGSVVLLATAMWQRMLDDEFVQVRGFVQGEVELHQLPGKHAGLLWDERVHQIADVVAAVVKSAAPG